MLWRVVAVAVVAVLATCHTAQALPTERDATRSVLEEMALIEDEKLVDNKVCPASILDDFHATMGSAEGQEHNCPHVVTQAIHNEQPLLDDVCVCDRLLSQASRNLYDVAYDCVIAPGVWNIREVSRMCGVPEPQESDITTPQNISCVAGVSCVHGKCVDDVCLCDRSGVNATHPDWTGADCSQQWCPDECSGNGYCNMTSGVCVCDSKHEGSACNVMHEATALTAVTVSENAILAAENFTIPKATPKPTKGVCWKALSEANAAIEAALDGGKDLDVPTCNSDGSWVPLQCNFVRQMCWCVNELGERYADSVLPSSLPPTCNGYDGPSVIPLVFDFKPAPPIITSDKCAVLACGPNGYCDATARPVRCVCLDGYKGTNCEIAPRK